MSGPYGEYYQPHACARKGDTGDSNAIAMGIVSVGLILLLVPRGVSVGLPFHKSRTETPLYVAVLWGPTWGYRPVHTCTGHRRYTGRDDEDAEMEDEGTEYYPRTERFSPTNAPVVSKAAKFGTLTKDDGQHNSTVNDVVQQTISGVLERRARALL